MKVILLPGLDGTGKLFYTLVELLKKYDVQVISYSNKEKYTYEELILLVKSQLPKEEEYIIIAESFSGVIAYNIALEEPINLKLIVFVATFIQNPRPFLSKFMPKVVLQFLSSLPLLNVVSKKILLNNSTDKKLITFVTNTINNINSKILFFRLFQIMNLRDVTQKVTINSIYLQASNDYLVPKSAYVVFEKYIPNIHFHKVEGSHLLLQTNPRECVEIINKYLERIKGTGYLKNKYTLCIK